ncbi:tyrosine-type recombinase/integrase [Rhodoligotrophos defluvii]|uniref:tyrosine-type recombinase/integrase n=1 Tax=Rhodoligotrophos defluvii TaxID=2561934 RepID=UPI0010C9A782|nr:tyrosine-type recombinase/integrase [Rhodoligotrophos defluvii]
MPEATSDLPWVNKRGDTYYVFWYDEKAQRTERKTLGTKDAAEARRKYAEFLVGEPVTGSPSGLTVSEALDDYLKEHVRVKCVASERREVAIRHLKEFFKTTPLAQVDILLSRRYVQARLNGETSGSGRLIPRKVTKLSTVRYELTTLISAARHACEWKRITQLEIPKIELPEVDTAERPFLTEDEVQMLLLSTSGWLHDWIMIAYYTGARKESVSQLKKSQIDRVLGRINLQPYGRKKTNKRKPVVPIFPEIADIIDRRMKDTPGDYLFEQPCNVYGPFKRACEALGLHGRSNPHILRHSRATNLLHQGESLFMVAKLLGDRSETIDVTYGHASPEHIQFKSVT